MKILYVTTISNTVNAFLIPHIKMLTDQGHQVDVAFNTVQEVKQEIIDLGCQIHNIEFQRSPFSRQNFYAYKKLKKLLEEGKYEIVHTHTPIASACVRLVCKKLKAIRVVYTAHGFHFYKGAPLQNWLIYFLLEKWFSKDTDVLITINKEDYKRANNKLKAKRVEYVPGVGLNTKKITNLVINRHDKRKELGIPTEAFVILSIGELNKNKNHEIILKAISKLKDTNLFYVICGQGPLEYYLKELITELGLNKQVALLGFRKDIAEICKSADLFVFPSYREGLPVSLMEAMAAGLPAVCSNIRGNVDLIEHNLGGYLVKPNDVDAFAKAITVLNNNQDILTKFSKYNLSRVNMFCNEKVNEQMDNIYYHLRGEKCGK